MKFFSHVIGVATALGLCLLIACGSSDPAVGGAVTDSGLDAADAADAAARADSQPAPTAGCPVPGVSDPAFGTAGCNGAFFCVVGIVACDAGADAAADASMPGECGNTPVPDLAACARVCPDYVKNPQSFVLRSCQSTGGPSPRITCSYSPVCGG